MAKIKQHLLYAGIAAAAILLLKKKDTGMAGVGAAIKSTLLIDGDFLLAKEVASLLANSGYIDKFEESHVNDGIYKTIHLVYPSFKKTEEVLLYILNILQTTTNYTFRVHLNNKYVKDFSMQSPEGKSVRVVALKSSISHIYNGETKKRRNWNW